MLVQDTSQRTEGGLALIKYPTKDVVSDLFFTPPWTAR